MSNPPGVRPVIPHFSSGPCAKRPGWSLQALTDAILGRSHRSKAGKAKLKRAIDLTREVLQAPADYRIGIVPASDTGVSTGSIVNPGKRRNFAWAWMAGVAFQVQPNWIVDVGFRHLQLGDAEAADGARLSNNAPIFRDLSANEIRVGVRYLLD